MATKPSYVSTKEFDKIFRSVCNWGRWGEDDEKGTRLQYPSTRWPGLIIPIPHFIT
jgi:hypothetical protein